MIKRYYITQKRGMAKLFKTIKKKANESVE